MVRVFVTTVHNTWVSGYDAWGETYDTFSRRQFEKRFRERNGLKRKHIKFVYAEDPENSLETCIAKLAHLTRAGR